MCASICMHLWQLAVLEKLENVEVLSLRYIHKIFTRVPNMSVMYWVCYCCSLPGRVAICMRVRVRVRVQVCGCRCAGFTAASNDQFAMHSWSVPYIPKKKQCSINNVKSLKHFRHSTKLRELYLRRNDVSDLTELGYLAKLTDLRVRTLSVMSLAGAQFAAVPQILGCGRCRLLACSLQQCHSRTYLSWQQAVPQQDA